MRNALVALLVVAALAWLGVLMSGEDARLRSTTERQPGSEIPRRTIAATESDEAARPAGSSASTTKQSEHKTVRERNARGVKVIETLRAKDGIVLLVLDAGTSHELKQGDEMQLKRNDDLVGFAKITRVLRDRSVAEFDTGRPGPSGPARVGDRAWLVSPEGDPIPFAGPVVRAVVDIDKKKMVIVTINGTHEVNPGDELTVTRNDRFVCRVRVERVSREAAIGPLDAEDLGKIGMPKRGDRVELP